MKKTLGILGGMGPAATVAFLARVQALTPAGGDQPTTSAILAGHQPAGPRPEP
jgi:aspartate/glutamate racemase